MQSLDTNALPSEDLKASAAATLDDTVLNTKLDFVLVEAFEKKVLGTFATRESAIAAAMVANRRSPGDARFLLATIVGETYLNKFTARDVAAPDYSAHEKALDEAKAEAQAQKDVADELRIKVAELEKAVAALAEPKAKNSK